jgi:hypothetical protein
MKTTDFNIATALAAKNPALNRKLQDLLVDASKYLENQGKISFFSGHQKKKSGEFLKTIQGLIIDAASLLNSKITGTSISAMEIVCLISEIKNFESAYPNWPDEYALLHETLNEMLLDVAEDVQKTEYLKIMTAYHEMLEICKSKNLFPSRIPELEEMGLLPIKGFKVLFSENYDEKFC